MWTKMTRRRKYGASPPMVENFDQLPTVESARSPSPTGEEVLGALLTTSCLQFKFDDRPPLDATLLKDHLHEDEPSATQLESNRIRCRKEQRGEMQRCIEPLGGMLLADYSLRTVLPATLPPGIAQPVTPLLTLLTLSAIPIVQQVVFSSSGLARKGGYRTQTVGHMASKDDCRYSLTCMFANPTSPSPISIPDRMQRHVALGRMVEDHPHLLKVLSVFIDTTEEENIPRGVDTDRCGQHCMVTVTHAFTHTLAQEIDRRHRIRLTLLEAAGRDIATVEKEDLPSLFGEQSIICLLQQLLSALLHLANAPVPVNLTMLTPDIIFLQRRMDAPPMSHSLWDTDIMLGVFVGTTPSNLLSLCPGSVALHQVGPRLNTEGRSAGLGYVVHQLLGGVDPIQYIGDNCYSRRCCRVLTHILEEDWDVHVALQQVMLLLFGDPQKGPASLTEVDDLGKRKG
eukprot:GGOE01041848.1.p1 GENE.GGOE01041848.1~~GGOE01041848.1.p1  ORF type:complete len:455 (-),score=102.18 GGOE01041848.1:202-1566(-)